MAVLGEWCGGTDWVCGVEDLGKETGVYRLYTAGVCRGAVEWVREEWGFFPRGQVCGRFGSGHV